VDAWASGGSPTVGMRGTDVVKVLPQARNNPLMVDIVLILWTIRVNAENDGKTAFSDIDS